MTKTLTLTAMLATFALHATAQTNAPVLHLDSYQPNFLILEGPHGFRAYFAAVNITVSSAVAGSKDVILFSGSDTNLLGPSTNWQSVNSAPAPSNTYSLTVYPPMTNPVGYFRMLETR